MRINRFGMAALLGAALALSSTSAKANLINFDFATTSGNGFDIVGTLNISNTLDSVGGYDITGISGTVFYLGGGITSTNISSLVNNPNQPNAYNNGTYIYDNVGYAGNPHLDDNGVLFTAGKYSYNIYYNDGVYYLSTDKPGGTYNPGDPGNLFTTSGVPELSTWGMMLIGFATIGFAAYRRAKKATLAAV